MRGRASRDRGLFQFLMRFGRVLYVFGITTAQEIHRHGLLG